MLDGAMGAWFVLTAVSVLFVVGDSIVNGVTSWVQRIAWILVTIYTGPVGLFFYLLACRRPFPGGHDRFTRATWKQSLNSEMHCLAGDATGIIVAAAIVPVLALGNGWDMTIEYVAAFVTGLFIFQALMMIRMYSGDYAKAVHKTIFAETVSMNFVMIGMIPVMVILEATWAGSESPLDPAFWFRMSLAAVAGSLSASDAVVARMAPPLPAPASPFRIVRLWITAASPKRRTANRVAPSQSMMHDARSPLSERSVIDLPPRRRARLPSPV